MRVGNLENICLGNAAYRLVTARIVSHFQVGGLKKSSTVFENQRKSRIQYCERSGQKLIKNAKNYSFWRAFENLKLAVKQCYQTGQL